MIKEPIFIIENGDISIFKSIEILQEYLEIFDIENNEYVAYDSKGLKLNFQIINIENNSFFNLVESNYDQNKLFLEIASFLKRININENFAVFGLSEIINLLIEKVGYTK